MGINKIAKKNVIPRKYIRGEWWKDTFIGKI